MTVKSVYITNQEEQYGAIAREAQMSIEKKDKVNFKSPLYYGLNN